MMKIRKGMSLLLAAVLAFSMGACGSASPTTTDSAGTRSASDFSFRYDTQTALKTSAADNSASLASFTKCAESDYLNLYVNSSTSCVVAEDKRNGDLWSTIPLDLSSDTVASSDMQEMMQSVLTVEYTKDNAANTLYSYKNCVAYGNLQTEALTNGIRLIFEMNISSMTYDDLPKKISDERFKAFFVNNAALTDTDVKRISSYFQYDEAQHVWVRVKENLTVLRALSDIMKRVGYNDDELIYDNEENGIAYRPPERIGFTVAVDYTLDNDSLVVDVPMSEFSYNDGYPPTAITVNPLLLQARDAKNGYLFIPDGSGALIDFSTGKADTGSYTLPLYGSDTAIANASSASGKSIQANMPVYGIVRNNSAVLAIIEDGDALAGIKAQKAYTLSSYNSVTASFALTNSAKVIIGDGSVISNVSVTQSSLYAGSLRTRYVIIAKDANYSTMANCYKQYLSQRDGLTVTGYSDKVTLMLQLYGAISKEDSLLGFRYNGMEALTTFEQARQILEMYNTAAISHILVNYVGALKGGIKNEEVTGADLLSALGGKKGYTQLADYLKGSGGSVYLSASVMTVSQSSGNYNATALTSRTIDQSLSKQYDFDMVTGEKAGLSYRISPGKLGAYVNAFLSSAKGISGFSFSDLGNTLYSDYKNGSVITRQDAKADSTGLLKSLSDSGNGLLLDDPYVDCASYADGIIELPLYSTDMAIISESVPFLPIVLSGCVPYAGEAYNQTEDTGTWMLKVLETGAEPYFALFYAQNTVLRNTDYTNLTSNNYELWFEDSLRVLNECQSVRDKVAGSYIVSHECVQPDVYKTTYANGWSVLTNYNSGAVTYNGNTIDACGYLLTEGE